MDILPEIYGLKVYIYGISCRNVWCSRIGNKAPPPVYPSPWIQVCPIVPYSADSVEGPTEVAPVEGGGGLVEGGGGPVEEGGGVTVEEGAGGETRDLACGASVGPGGGPPSVPVEPATVSPRGLVSGEPSKGPGRACSSELVVEAKAGGKTGGGVRDDCRCSLLDPTEVNQREDAG